MNPEFLQTHQHMLNLGLGALAHANWHANYFAEENVFWPELSVLQAAHAAEILIKARISQEHPLLIFEKLPNPKTTDNTTLELQHLIEEGRTYQYSDLPNRLWATTGIQLPNRAKYEEFGRLRNSIQHFASPKDRDIRGETIEFIYSVIDPFINQCWDLFAIDFNEDYEPYTYLIAGLIRGGVRFLVSPDCVEAVEFVEMEWPDGDPSYRKEIEARISLAMAASLKGDQTSKS